ncbi:hypothetical protein DN523_01340 [Burkholderia multivorans]|nr:hypothetical protein DN470_16720 [Burkholderia multivorans]RAA32737.1 hypothetical protein DN471_01985 [Burkholderia multivorans]RAA33092.1 hypothetical protein DN465_17535 [Burkholderia multivorans]RAA40714.1 hypothetical protein DN472_21940 [Burkholderia multivorans]RAA48248.1 hypothetical protein DN500_08625 [Burkholderia multivorans]
MPCAAARAPEAAASRAARASSTRPARWSKRIRPTGPTCEKSACLHFPRQIAALKHLRWIDPKRTIRRQA